MNDLILFYKQKNVNLIKKKLSQLIKKEIIVHDLKNYQPQNFEQYKNQNDIFLTKFVSYIQYFFEWIQKKDDQNYTESQCLEYFVNQTTDQLLHFYEEMEGDKYDWFLPLIKFQLYSVKWVYKKQLENNISETFVQKIRSFLQAKKRQQQVNSLYLLFDKLRLICIRNLFNKIWKLYASKSENKDTNQIPLEILAQGFQFSINFDQQNKQVVDKREVACIIGNLCMLKLIKGYIFNKNILVVKKQDPFPNVWEVVKSMKADAFL
ncbi:hypothetical protein PPERSA_06922 [Pseudocohnilembus persalinus]|uniref:PCI domain-containing protein n=1 Tax=Pseudocohnilembus persalinus TaxID=266149 RepID=A0A0V0QYG6_PSEPJ|nr:hypothetical protein PPERSA_06922 [Pseudocohnilembus persalinus]|eukprot:KRX07307.1 hypothetical protein PPERSA_06922 [Pseudocohnilembus persalinus]